jgi:hypothetical protein
MPKLTKQEIKRREREWMEYHRSRQREVNAMFPSTLPNSRGAVSPLGGVAVAKPSVKGKR